MKTSGGRLFAPRLVVSNDGALSPRTAADNAARFRQLILPHLDGAYTLARYLTRDPVLSEDIVQDAFVRAFQAFPGFRGDSPRAWLLAIVRNCARTAMTRSGTSGVVRESDLSADEATVLLDRPDSAPTPEDCAIKSAEVAEVRLAIEALPEPFREALVLREMEGFSYAEIGEITGVPIGTVMSRLSRARSMIADILLPRNESGSGNQPSRSSK